MKVSKITIGRLFNLGNYEHIRYEVTVEIPEGESAAKAMLGMEKIMVALAPERNACLQSLRELERERVRLVQLEAEAKALAEQDEVGAFEFHRKHGFFEGTPKEYVARRWKMWQENVDKRDAWDARAARARELLDNLGGATEWKDAKLEWEEDEQF